MNRKWGVGREIEALPAPTDPFGILSTRGSPSNPHSLFPIPCSYDARASSIMGASRCEPLRGPRLRALITLMRSSSS